MDVKEIDGTKIPWRESQGRSIGGYELFKKLGRGAVGTVYVAYETSTHRVVAVKLLREELGKSRAFVERFLRQAHAAAKLNHPNIVRTLDAGYDQGCHYLVMEHVDGPTVAQRMRTAGRLSELEALTIARDVAAGLLEADRHKIVHRDIKPENIILTSDGITKLADVGTARDIDGRLAIERSVLGTPHYMSPEQARSDANIDVRSDIYSLGATLFHMVTGNPPFGGSTPDEIIAKRLSAPAPDPRSQRPSLSPATGALIMRMMETDPGRRIATAHQLLSAIEDVLSRAGGRSARVMEAAPRERRLFRRPELIAGICAAVAVAAVLFLSVGREPEPGADEGDRGQAVGEIQTDPELPIPEIEDLVAEQTLPVRINPPATKEEAAEAYAAAFDEFVRPLLVEHAYAEAQQALEALGTHDDMKLAGELFQRDRADVARLMVLWERVERAAALLRPGQSVLVDGEEARFIEYKDGMLRYASDFAQVGTRLTRLRGEEALELIGPALLAEDESRVQAATFLIYDRDPNLVRAYELLEPIKGRPAIEQFRKRISTMAFGYDLEADETEAEAVFAALEKEIKRAPDQTFAMIAGFRAGYGHTRFFNEHLDDVAALKADIMVHHAAASSVGTMTTWQGHSYMHVQKPVCWHDAKELCEALGGHLLTISSQAEQNFIAEAFGGGPKQPPFIWLGATDERRERRWEWVTGEKWRFTSWHRGEPNNTWNNEDWAIMAGYDGRIEWNDVRDTAPYQFVCEWEEDAVELNPDMLRKLGTVGGILPRDKAVEYEKKLAELTWQGGRMLPIGYLIVGILNELNIPYRWDKSARLLDRTGLAARPINPDVLGVPAAAALKRILDPLGLDYTVDADGLYLRPRADDTEIVGPDQPRVQSLFDGKTLGAWQLHQGVGAGHTSVQGGYIILEAGEGPTILKWTGAMPANNYQVELDAMRLQGRNAFCNIAFPVGNSRCALIIGGWGNVVGIEALDGRLASANETTVRMAFEKRRWYHIRLRVRDSRIQAWIDEKKLIDLQARGRHLSQRMILFNPLPRFGLFTWHTKSAVRNVTLQRLEPGRD